MAGIIIPMIPLIICSTEAYLHKEEIAQNNAHLSTVSLEVSPLMDSVNNLNATTETEFDTNRQTTKTDAGSFNTNSGT